VSDPTLRACTLAAMDALEAARDQLCRLDSVAGDGDHGVTMALAARAARKMLEESPEAEGADLVAKVALAAGSVGGAIGPIYATALLRAATALRSLGPVAGERPVADLRASAQAALDGITAIGHAGPGDKTIVDALAPTVEALAEADATGRTLPDAIGAAVAAARDGAAATADMVATVGRASRLGERSRGSADPGASSFVVIVAAAQAAYLRGATDPTEGG
jgi:dihydroxyacetone kinase-like protein